jgi:colicin import membrane protein
LRDIGPVPLWTLRRAADRSELPYSRARRRLARREFLRERWIDLQREAERRTADLPQPIPADLLAPEASVDPTTDQFEALSEAVLEADLDEEAQVALLSDLEAARRLRHLEDEAQAKAAEADTQAERQLEEIEAEARTKIEEVEREARNHIEQLLGEAEAKSRKVNEQASRKVRRVAADVERKAERATKDAAREAKARAERRTKRRKEQRDKPKKD